MMDEQMDIDNPVQQQAPDAPQEPTLHQLVPPSPNDSVENWDAVIARVKSHPEEARQSYPWFMLNDDDLVDDEDYCVLHAVARHQPPMDAIGALIGANPVSVLAETGHNLETPLSYACKHGASSDVIRMLLHATIADTMRKGSKKSLLWFITDSETNLDVKKIVLEEYPAAARQSNMYDGFYPLDDIFGLYGRGYSSFEQEEKDSRWEILQLLLTVAQNNTSDRSILQGRDPCQLHAMFKYMNPDEDIGKEFVVICFVNMLTETLARDPAQFSHRNGVGDLPLHYLLQEKYWSGDEASGNGRRIIQIFLQAYPEAARTRDHLGRLPLQIATETQWPIDDLLAAEPLALVTRDLHRCFYPFQNAWLNFGTMWMVHAENNETDDTPALLRQLTTAYKLIRAEPNLLRFRGRGLQS